MRTDSEPRRNGTMIRFDADVHELIVAEAEARQVSMTWMVNRLVREGLERLVPVDQWLLTSSATCEDNTDG